jgi:uncharacterized membrane protein (UPF0127 family)
MVMLQEISINNKKLKIVLADTEASRKKGLSGLEKLGKGKGMLFQFPEPKKVWMIMTGMKFDLDFIFLDADYKIVQLNTLSKSNKDGVESFKPINMVLEVNKGFIKEAGVKLGQKFTVHSKDGKLGIYKNGGSFQKVGDIKYEVKEDDVKIEKNKLQVLNKEGEVTANIEPNARIFSREHTKQIIAKVKASKDEELGKLIVDIFNIHDTQKQDYVKK